MRVGRHAAVAATAAVVAATLPSASASESQDDGARSGPSTDTTDLDVLFVGAHPDDESGSLAAFGQWNEYDDLQAGVITITRGEGGGNADGLEEGPELGMIREAEERSAVGFANVEHVYNLDEVDFFYNASAPLTDEAWGHDDTLERVVRVVRATKPEVIVTMDPAPTAGNHGHHQQAARFAVEAYEAAADPDAFSEQISDEGLSTWRTARILQGGASGSGEAGSACESTPYEPDDPSDRVFGVWEGRTSDEAGETWAMRETRAQWEYVSQGWSGFPPPPDDPEEIGCDWFTLIDSRTPYPEPAGGPTTALQGAALPMDDGLSLGTELTVDPERFQVVPGESFTATVNMRADTKPIVRPELAVSAPEGWQIEQADSTPHVVPPHRDAAVDVTVTPPADADVDDRVSLEATLTTPHGSGTNAAAVETAPRVHGELAQRPEADVFAEWTQETDLPKLESLIAPIASVGTGRTEPAEVDVTNESEEPADGTVRLDLADGFSAEPAEQSFTELAPGETTTVTFDVTNDDTSLPTSNRAPDGGYPLKVVTDVGDDTAVQEATLELVPSTEIPHLDTAPTVDGVADEAEYPGEELDASTVWEGDDVTPDDASAVTRMSSTDDALYVTVDVTDDTLGNVLPPEDCKRHWRSDAVEITVDPRGTSSNTSTTFKSGIFPTTDEPENDNPACFQRDADNNQGPGEETAPGMEVSSVVNEPYDGYTVEAKIPFDVLPDKVDPERMGLNVLVYDSDTQDNTGQTRIGWSTFQGVQGDPFRWALATLPGLPATESDPVEPTLPETAALSINSPQSIAQSATDGVGLGGGPALPERTARVTAAEVSDGVVDVSMSARDEGQANVFVRDGEQVVGQTATDVERGRSSIEVPVEAGDDPGDLEVLVAYITDDGTLALAHPADD